MGSRSLHLCLRATDVVSYRLFCFFLSRTPLKGQDIYQVYSTVNNIFIFICTKVRNSISGAVTGTLPRPRRNRVSIPRRGIPLYIQPCSGSHRTPVGLRFFPPVKLTISICAEIKIARSHSSLLHIP
jgi:hypothetical protein